MRPEDEKPATAARRQPDCRDGAHGHDDFFHAHAPEVYTLVSRLLGGPTGASEVTLGVLLDAVENPTITPGEAKAESLRSAAVRAVQSHRRQAGRFRAFHPPQGPAVRPPATTEGEAGPEHVEQALAGLPAAQRDVFVLVDVEAMGHEAAAGLLGVSADTLKRRLHNARLLVRDSLFAAPASSQDRRKARRDPANLTASVRPAAGTEATEAVVANRSSGGMALWVSRPLAVGSPLLVRAEPARESEGWLLVEVRYCHERESGGWAVGCRVVG
jgi:DNA-directed RNA polymerase specialized sigma24 family protein